MDNNEKLLQEIYKNAKIGQASIMDVMDRVSDGEFRGEITSHLESYRRFADEASEKLGERGLKPKELTTAEKAGSKMGIAFGTMLDTTTSRIAEIMINGATAGVVGLEKQLNEGGYSPEATSLAEDVIRFRRSSAERFGTYL